MVRRFLAVAVLLGASLAASAAELAFPGAEGFGATSRGGWGGRVIKVTNLDSEGPGSLAAAAAAEGPRIVVFEVAGVIRGDVEIKHPRITIAGQTAPSPGITLEGRLRAVPAVEGERLHDIIVRFLRIRPPHHQGVGGDAVQLPKSDRVILDHLSLSWANDETIDIIHSADVTVQWSTLEESDPGGHAKGERHNFGLISAYPGSGNISIHHNLFAHHSRRNPSLSPGEPGMPGDFRNNVVYNFREGLNHDGHEPKAPINLIGNYYKRGPDSGRVAPFEFNGAGRYYLAGNVLEGVGELEDPRRRLFSPRMWLRGVSLARGGGVLDQPAPVAPVTTHSAEQAYRLVLERAGAFPRDRVTRRTLEEVRRGKGGWRRHGPERLEAHWLYQGLPQEQALLDSDIDGLPDAWEKANGLDPHDPNDYAQELRDGMSAIRLYLAERAAMLIPAESEPDPRTAL